MLLAYVEAIAIFLSVLRLKRSEVIASNTINTNPSRVYVYLPIVHHYSGCLRCQGWHK